MNEMGALMNALAAQAGFNDTPLPGVRIFKGHEYAETVPFTYEQGLILVGHGAERVYFEGNVYEYDTSNYLAVTLPISAVGEVLESNDGPMLAMAVDFNLAMLSAILLKLNDSEIAMLAKPARIKGLYLSPRTADLDETASRLLRVLRSPLEAKVLGPLLIEELLFRILVGGNGHFLKELTEKSSRLARVDKVLKWMHAEYQGKIDIDRLATMANMSASVFHKAFKELTAMSPMQYLKSLRLSKARELLISERASVGDAAHSVGYESVSQFSREFKRAYGAPPKDTKRHIVA